MTIHTPIAETNRFIVLDEYKRDWMLNESYQSEDALEQELIEDLKKLGYVYEPELNTSAKLLANVRTQLQLLNKFEFSDAELGELSGSPE
jgi:type I restriction enzyme, R subunit